MTAASDAPGTDGRRSKRGGREEDRAFEYRDLTILLGLDPTDPKTGRVNSSLQPLAGAE
jgi:hypothetical protein